MLHCAQIRVPSIPIPNLKFSTVFYNSLQIKQTNATAKDHLKYLCLILAILTTENVSIKKKKVFMLLCNSVNKKHFPESVKQQLVCKTYKLTIDVLTFCGKSILQSNLCTWPSEGHAG